ncbi:pilus assembly protein [Kribbella soli]
MPRPPAAHPTANHPNRLDRTAGSNPTTCSHGTKSWHRSDRGAVTAELAIALPVLFSLLLLGIWSIGLVVLNIRCIDAARDVARAVARGEPLDQAKAIGRRTVPTGTITITRESSDIHVAVTAIPTHTPPLLTVLTPTRLTATATLQAEPETTP